MGGGQSAPRVSAESDSELQTEIGPPKSRRAESKAANREEILTAARRVFMVMGYETATVRDIIRETSLASGTFYNYFRSKEEVASALNDESIAAFRPRLALVRDETETFSEYVNGAFEAFFEFLAEEHARSANGEGAKGVKWPTLRDTPGQRVIFEELRSDLRKAHERGEIPGLDFGFFAAACIGMAQEVGERMLRRDPVDPKAAADFCATAVLALIKF